MAASSSSYPPLRQWVVQGIFVLSMGWNMVTLADDLSWWMLPALLVGWYVADTASGLVHMYMDYRPCVTGKGLDDLYFYQGARDTPDYQARFAAAMRSINPLERLVYDFKNHHPRPHALGRRALWRQIGSTVLYGTLPASLILNAADYWIGLPGWAMAGALAYLIGGTFAQYFHGTLHRDDNPWIVRAMRRVGLLMTPAAHQLHHDTLQRDFSTNCGWSNPLLNRVFRWCRAHGMMTDAGLEPHG